MTQLLGQRGLRQTQQIAEYPSRLFAIRHAGDTDRRSQLFLSRSHRNTVMGLRVVKALRRRPKQIKFHAGDRPFDQGWNVSVLNAVMRPIVRKSHQLGSIIGDQQRCIKPSPYLCRQTFQPETTRMAARDGSKTASGTRPNRRPPMNVPQIEPAAITRTKDRFLRNTEKLWSLL